MTTIRQLIKTIPSRAVLSVSPTDTVYTAIELMSDEHVGALLVMVDNEVVGIVTERDYARKVILQNRTSRSTPVSEIMSRGVLYVTSEDSAEACMALMVKKQIAHLPVIDDGELVGLISMGDLARVIISDHEILIDQLTNYIGGDRSQLEHPERMSAGEQRTKS